MTPQKPKNTGSSTSETPTSTASPTPRQRKPWVKRSPVDIMLAQIDRLRDDVATKKEEYELAKRQLDKLETVRKALEGT
jgi:hypothetical protein